MTGTVKNLSDGHTFGFIKTEDGRSVYFEFSAVLECDLTYLAVGQQVTFEVENGNHPKAVNIQLQRQHSLPQPDEKRQQPGHLRYMGFEQTGSIRAYAFERIAPGEKKKETLVVTADLELFKKHHVGIQEGPALCLHLLMAQLDSAGAPPQLQLRRSLADHDMLAHLATLPVPGARHRHRRIPAHSH